MKKNNLTKPKVAVFKFASCDGCQLSLLDCENELLAVVGAIEIANFPEASRKILEGPYDISLVEGSVTTPHDKERIFKVRKESEILISIGACATSGGIQALKNFSNVKEFTNYVYANPQYISSLEKSHPISDFVKVDFELRGCPINKYQLLEVINAFLNRRKPNISSNSVCIDCKRNGINCVMVSKNIPCIGPITHTGCNALCPSYNRGCFGCYGPKEFPNTSSLADYFLQQSGLEKIDILRLLRSFNGNSESFKNESKKYEN